MLSSVVLSLMAIGSLVIFASGIAVVYYESVSKSHQNLLWPAAWIFPLISLSCIVDLFHINSYLNLANTAPLYLLILTAFGCVTAVSHVRDIIRMKKIENSTSQNIKVVAIVK